jgi:adenylyltransferase/sulfurtransferase
MEQDGESPDRQPRVLIVGLGGLGSPAAIALAASGAAELTLIDHDEVALSNLHRQILFEQSDTGSAKIEVATRRLRQGFPGVRIRAHADRIDATNADRVLSGHAFVIDGSDTAETKFVVHDAAVRLGIALSYAGVVGWQGQALTVLPGRTACLRCLFPQPPLDEEVPTCQQAGVLGGLVASFGAIQAMEAIKFLSCREEELLAGRLLTYDARQRNWRVVGVTRRADCSLCGALGSGPRAVAKVNRPYFPD